MAIPESATILHYLRHTVLRRAGADPSDGQLLRSFFSRDDEAAFEALVRRHGSMVHGVCRRVLRNVHDADDAFQATFLVLIRKASTLAAREVIGDWLHGVAYRTASKARTSAVRRRMKEKRALRSEAIFDEHDRSEWLPLLDEEINRLPSKYRLPVVLCDLEGRTRKEAAQQIGCPEGTVSGRLSRARAMLARRLIRRGMTLSVGALAAGLPSEVSARVPLSLVASITKTVREFTAQSVAVLAHVAALTEGVIKAMFVTKLKKVTAVVMAVFFLSLSAGAWRYALVAGQEEETREGQSNAPKQSPPQVAGTKDEAKALPIPSGKRSFQTDLCLTRIKNGQREVLAYPRSITRDGKEAAFGIGPDYVYSINHGQCEAFRGTNLRVRVCSGDSGKLGLVLTMNQPTVSTFAKDATVEGRTLHVLRWIELGKPITVELRIDDKGPISLELTVAVEEADRAAKKDSDVNMFPDVDTIRQSGYGYFKPPPPTEQEKKDLAAKRNEAAEKDFKMAEFYRRTNNPDAARFYSQLIRYRYPETDAAKRVKQRLAKDKPPARVGQIFIIGNKKIPDKDILKGISLFPGQVLTFTDIRDAEQKLSQLTGLKNRPTLTVIDREGAGVFKDIEITVEEK